MTHKSILFEKLVSYLINIDFFFILFFCSYTMQVFFLVYAPAWGGGVFCIDHDPL